MSLARGFVYSGVPSIMMTLWEVQDESSALIMDRFYTYIKAGERKDIALQKAKTDFLVDANMLKSHPYYWSSYIISGKTTPLTCLEDNTSYYYVIAISAILLIIVLMVYLKAKSAKNK